MPRMRILSAADQARFEHPPVFDSAERKRYFNFPRFVMDAAQDLRGPANWIGFLLAYGYFRASRRFFLPDTYLERDIAWVSRAIDLPLDTFTPRNSDVLTPCAAKYRRQVGNFLLGRAILALRNSLPYLMMDNLIRAEIRGCGDLTNRLNSEKPRLRRASSTFPGYPKLGQTPKFRCPDLGGESSSPI